MPHPCFFVPAQHIVCCMRMVAKVILQIMWCVANDNVSYQIHCVSASHAVSFRMCQWIFLSMLAFVQGWNAWNVRMFIPPPPPPHTHTHTHTHTMWNQVHELGIETWIRELTIEDGKTCKVENSAPPPLHILFHWHLVACECARLILYLVFIQELLEKALGGLRHKLQGSRANPAEAERYRKQQRVLEKELSRIRLLLAHNSKVKLVTCYIHLKGTDFFTKIILNWSLILTAYSTSFSPRKDLLSQLNITQEHVFQ
jgi:hypothetical protein